MALWAVRFTVALSRHGAFVADDGEFEKSYEAAVVPEFIYSTRRTHEAIGPYELEIEALADLNQTIDDLFDFLEPQGRAAELEKLAPYFGVVWASGRALAEYLARGEAGRLEGLGVLELGCGLALPSLVASRMGAEVTCADSHPEVPRFLRRNLELNPESRRVALTSLDWDGDSRLGTFDLVLGSDVLYERTHAPAVARAIVANLKPGGRLLLADPGRPYLQSFADELKRLGLPCETIILSTTERSPTGSEGPREIFLLRGTL